MNIQLKPMKLQFIRHDNFWDKVITDMDGNILFEQRNIILFPEQINVEYFNEWEAQMKGIPKFNIVEVERFI
jgi:hypothetical protein